MKKFITFITIALMFVSAQAQERTVNIAGNNSLVDLTVSKNVAYNGGTSDRLIPTTRDTIDYFIVLKNYNEGPIHFYAQFVLDTIAGADTTVLITVQEKKFSNETYTDVIASAATSAIGSEVKVVKTSLGVITEFTETIVATNTTRLVNTLLRYRYLKFRLILPGNDSVGTGVKVKRVEIQFFQ